MPSALLTLSFWPIQAPIKLNGTSLARSSRENLIGRALQPKPLHRVLRSSGFYTASAESARIDTRETDPAATAGKFAAEGQLTAGLGRLFAVAENYPQLRSNEQFMRLQDELSGTENRIGVARRRYNDTLRDYNTFVREFPNSIWANILGFHVNDAYFEASAASRNAPAVKF